MQDKPPEGFAEIWKQAVPMILKSPQVLSAVCMTWVIGYGVSFLLFEYRATPRQVSTWLHLSLGGGYAACIFAVVNWRLLFGQTLSFDHITQRAPQTIVISAALLFLTFLFVVVIRERRQRS